ncbi:hypothetical protein CCYA_CCYA11G3188 [Cyanidiococcus yangmingshanensis]|nr:hypothetical protein CCYA_CCYA11G3188 [Cyanidiococcus yangmingshanensis]
MRPIYSTLTTSNSTNKPPVQKTGVLGSGAVKDLSMSRTGTATTAQSVFRKPGSVAGVSAPTAAPHTAPLRPFNAGNISAIRPTAEVIAATTTTNIGKADDSFEQENMNPMQRWKRAVERHNQKLGIASESSEPAPEQSMMSQRERPSAPRSTVGVAPEPPARNVRSRWPPGSNETARAKASAATGPDANTVTAPQDASAGHVFGGGKGEEMFRRRFQAIEATAPAESEPRATSRKPPTVPQQPLNASEGVSTAAAAAAAGQVLSGSGPFIRKFQAFAADSTSGAPSTPAVSSAPMRSEDGLSTPSTHSSLAPPMRLQGVAASTQPVPNMIPVATTAQATIQPQTASVEPPSSNIAVNTASANTAPSMTVPIPTGVNTEDRMETPQESPDLPAATDQQGAPSSEPAKEAINTARNQSTSRMSSGHRTPLQVVQIRSELEEARREHRLLLKKLTGIERERDSVRAERAQLQNERAALARDRDALVARVMRLRQLIKQQASTEEPIHRPRGPHAKPETHRRRQNRAAWSDEELSRPSRRRQRSLRAPERRLRRQHRPLNESLREVGVRLGRWWRKLFIAPRSIDDSAIPLFDDDDSDVDDWAYASVGDARPDGQRRSRRGHRPEAVADRTRRLRQQQQQARRSRERAPRSAPSVSRDPDRMHAGRRPAGMRARAMIPSETMAAALSNEAGDACVDSSEECEHLPKTALLELEQQLRSLVHRLQAMDTVLVAEDEVRPDDDATSVGLAADAGRGAKSSAARRSEPIDAAADGPLVMRRQNPHVRSGMRGISRPIRRQAPSTGGNTGVSRSATAAHVGALVKSPRRSARETRRSVAQALQSRHRLTASEALLSDSESVSESDDVEQRRSMGNSFEMEPVDSIMGREASQEDSLLYPNADW